MEETPFGDVPIPDAAQTRFETREGISLEVISELFMRMDMPKQHQEQFWKQVAFKPFGYVVGTQIDIATYKDGRTWVRITDPGNPGNNINEIFYHKRDMTDKQLDELKRADNNNKKVAIHWQKEVDTDGNTVKKPINSVMVFGSKVQ